MIAEVKIVPYLPRRKVITKKILLNINFENNLVKVVVEAPYIVALFYNSQRSQIKKVDGFSSNSDDEKIFSEYNDTK